MKCTCLAWVLLSMALGCGSSATPDRTIDADQTPAQDSGSVSAEGSGSPSPLRLATAAELEALVQAWCAAEAGCPSDFDPATCDERRASLGKPELYVADPIIALTQCLVSSCNSPESCITTIARDITFADPSAATYTPSQGRLFNLCGGRRKECEVQGALTNKDCYWIVFLSDAILPKVADCLAQPCTQYHSCSQALTK